MTTNALIRIRSKSISDVFSSTEWEEDKEDLLPKKDNDYRKSAFEKWKSSFNLNLLANDQQFGRRTSRGNSKFFSRPPLPSNPRPRRQSLAATLRRTSIKDDLKKIWDTRRVSLCSLKTQIKDKMTGRSHENLANRATHYCQKTSCDQNQNETEESLDDSSPPAFFIVDKSVWTRS
ncbi:uncharacterized protein CELE_F02D8.1 [Caenorhabditis elegans]|uniref:Uncharacterized protein n=1 Tax=Caenorhabditis elegans TaxID=6239 RepID=Q19118_CAEEL|nr:Uncharacterized protein CELE_F02D8.1 [Caenorhabditis elegans]CAB01644.2 Uncharacterized protein CELE_F02D8.1 [Caenorhabditis elegans]|eukprot:NP_506681.2 Uncharacterized protein CELE_F02D8.1 [Caenorhabditis elegans]